MVQRVECSGHKDLELKIGHGLGSWMTEPEREMLVNWAAETVQPGETVVEIGCFSGGTTAALAYATGAHVVAIDPFTNDTPVEFHGRRCSLSELFRLNLEERGLVDSVEVLEMPSQLAGPFWQQRTEHREIAFLLVDGDHTGPAVREDMGWFAPYVRVGGMLIADDYNDPPVRLAVEEWMSQQPPGSWELVYWQEDTQIAKLAAYRRLA